MSASREREVEVNGKPCRVWERGEGEALGFLAGLGGLRTWPAFLDLLAAQRRVVAPSLPGFPGGLGHDRLDDLADWITATLDLLEGAGLEGVDLMGASVGGALAAEAAAFSPAVARRLVLVAPFGLFDEAEPVADVFATKPREVAALLSARPEAFAAAVNPPEGTDPIEWQVVQVRAQEAAARLLWPTADLGLRKRLHRIRVPTLLVWGSEDRVVPASYAKRFAEGIAGPVSIRILEGAGHRVDFDAPEALANAVLEFLAS